MTIYTATKDETGALFLTNEQHKELENKGYDSTLIYTRLLELYELTKLEESVEEGGLEPCSKCGGSQFLRTGNCHVCTTCGDSQGCS
jgi:hypothetical protein